MSEIPLPLSITYETEGVTPVADVITALQATEALVKDAASVLRRFIDGLQVEKCSLNVRPLTQESPLREIFFISLFLAFQEDLEREVPSVLEDLFDISFSDDYDTLVTVAVLAIAFYGVGLAVDAVKKTFADSLPKEKFEDLVQVLAAETGKPAADIRNIIHARFGKPSAARRLVKSAKGVFLPSQRNKNAPMIVDRDRIPTEMIREVPYPGDSDQETDFDRYNPHTAVPLVLHAQDRDRSATGWAAVAPSVSESRLKLRVMDPIKPSALWGYDKIVADVVVVSKLTANGYTPSEIQITV